MTDYTNPRIIFIDDEKNILNAIRRLFHKSQYELFLFDDPKIAISRFGEIKPSVIVSDQRMPEMNGARVLEQARIICPDAIRIILTGFTDIETVIEAINTGNVVRFITKPWIDDELKNEIDDAVLMYHIEKEKLANIISSAAGKQISSERKKGISQLAGAICHEMNQPLQIAMGFAEILAGELQIESVHGKGSLMPIVQKIKNELNFMNEIMKKLMLIKYETKENDKARG